MPMNEDTPKATDAPIVAPPLRNSTLPMLLFVANVSSGISALRAGPDVGFRSWTWMRAEVPFVSILRGMAIVS